MSLTPGTRLGPYEILALIGVGGMGEVYRATDTKLKRQVAIKVLPTSVAGDADRLARFQREAEVLAALNHPNIAHIHGLEESNGIRALVMELVEGPTLADRIAKGAIPLDEALPIAKQIAEALEAAHEQGIIHRDLKPANTKVRDDGTVKVLDFGLAKAMEPAAGSSPSASMSPTITTPAMTQAGMILGTAAYMSPEQAKGRTVDRRADVWAFGAVLYEMLTGQRAFAGDDVSDTFVAIMRDEPDWARLPATLSPALGTFVRRCLQKDPKQRLRDIGDVRLALEGAFETVGAPTASSAKSSMSAGRLTWMTSLAGVAVLGMLAFAIPAVRHLRETPVPSPPETRTDIVTPATSDPISFALSPDGKQIVFVAAGDGAVRLWLRSLSATTAQPLAGTEGAAYPFWSPDSRSLGFFADGKLKRLEIAGGTPQILATAAPRGGSWNADGVVLFAPSTVSPLFRVPATGGEGKPVTKLDRQTSHRVPSFLPDGRHFLFYAQGTADAAGIYLGSLDSSDVQRLTEADAGAVSFSSGWVLFVRGGRLLAQRLDVERKAFSGDPIALPDSVAVDGNATTSALSVSSTGLVAYRTGKGFSRQLAWFDRSGSARGTLGAPMDDGLSSPSVSPDGSRAAVYRVVSGNADIWLLDGTRTTRFTFDPALDRFPVWSPDSRWIAFDSNRKGHRDVYRKAANGAGAEELLVESPQEKTVTDWSADGRFLLYHSVDPQTSRDLWVRPLDGDRKPWVFLKTRFEERSGAFSPDGRWVAYMSNESGRMEIYIRPFVVPQTTDAGTSAATAQWQVSAEGGTYPWWRRDGKELYYLDPAGKMMAAPISVSGATLTPSAPVALFSTRIVGGGLDGAQNRQYDVTRDGRFLINTVLDDAAAPITLLTNWNPEAKK